MGSSHGIPLLLVAGLALGLGTTPLLRPLTPSAQDAREGQQGKQGQTQYRILVTNDDGIDNPRLAALVLELAKIGEVVVVAPDGNRSGASHSMTTFTRPMIITQREIPGAKLAQAVSGTPADAVEFGIFTHGRKRPFDLVVSGMNYGHNSGFVAHTSGTVGGAKEAVLNGVPAVSVSSDEQQFDHAMGVRFAARFVRELLRRGAPKDVLFNINIPKGDAIREVVVAPMGGHYYRTQSFRRVPQEGVEAWSPVTETGTDGPAGCDTRHYCAGKITITPIHIDWTDHEMLKELREWDLRVR